MSVLQGAHKFEALVVGTSNRTAVTAGRAVANAPGSAYNPLLIYARPGMGKTHLLGAIAHQVFAMNPAARIEFITLDEFVEGFHVALSTGQGDRFRSRFGDADLLLVDDIQFLSRQREMQAELLRVLDVMLARQKQVVLTSDRAPSEIESLDDRLLTRFAGGLVLDIAQPDYETRVAILQRKAEERSASFPDGVLEAVASLEIESVRELVGALNRLIAYQAVSEAPIDAVQARVLIGGLQSAVESDELVVEQAETLEFAVAGHGEMVHAGSDERRLPADALPGVMLGQSDMLGGGPVDELSPHDGDEHEEHHDFGLAGEPHEYQDSGEPTRPRDQGSAPDPLREGLAEKPALQADRDEFGDFLSDLAATLARQVDPWRARVGEAILRWEGEGFRTYRLERLLEDPEPPDPESVMIQYEADAEQLLELRAEAESLSPEMAGAAQLTDPGNMAAAEAYMQRVREGAIPPAGPVEHWLLDDLIEGPGNRMAVRAAQAAIAEPGRKYNPIVVVGGSGVGKTHLLHGIGNALALASDGHVACLSAHDFTQELIEAIDRDAIAAWRNRYRRCSALLLDDVHLIAGKERTQEELFLLFNLFLETNRQLGFASAVPLAELSGVEPRLLTRLEGGLVVELPPPDRELRQQLVERTLKGRGQDGDAELVTYIASRPAESARAVQGYVQRVLHSADSQQVRASVALAREVLEGAARPVRKGSAPGRTISVAVASAGGVKSREKTVWSWPTLSERVIEEWK
jgi:chromosomal replication initiator protein DnaA